MSPKGDGLLRRLNPVPKERAPPFSAGRSAPYRKDGIGPTKKDVDLALVLLGYDTEGVGANTVAELAERRTAWFAAAGHHPAKLNEFVSCLNREILELTAEKARTRMAQGEHLITR